MSSTIYTIPPNLPLIREACGKALHCNSNSCLRVVQESVGNFDMESYSNG